MQPRRLVKLWLSLALVGAFGSFLASTAQAQATGTVRGVVRDAKNQQPLAGVQVNVIGTRLVSITERDGRYELANVPEGTVNVRVRLIGYATGTVQLVITGGTTVEQNFDLRESVIALDAVVVTGTGGAVERKQLGNTIAAISDDQFKNAPVQNFSEALAAREPSIAVLPSSGLSGAGSRIRIRGTASLSMSNEPVVYVDGVRVDNAGGLDGPVGANAGEPSRLDDINPEAIERIEVLKGAAAATLYGSEASAGVIQIFTKQGRTGRPRFDFRVEQGVSKYPDVYKPNAGFARNQTQADQLNELWAGDPTWTPVAPFQVFEREFVNDMFETGRIQVYSGSVTGGSDDFKYYVGGRFQRDNGPFGGEWLEPTIASGVPVTRDIDRKSQANFTFSLFPRDRISFRVSGMYTDTHLEVPNNGNNIYGVVSLAMFGKPERARCADVDGDGTQDVTGYQGTTPICEGAGNATGNAAFETVRESMLQLTQQDLEHYNGSITATYQAARSLNIDATLGVDVVSGRSFEFAPFGYNVDAFTSNNVDGFRNIGARSHREATFDLKGIWSVDFSDFSSTLTAGGQGFLSENKTSGGSGSAFPGPGLEVAGAAANQSITETALEKVNVGVYAQEQLGYKDFAFLTVGGRYDKNSAFGESAGGAFYPKAGISIVPSDLSGWGVGAISTLRVRAAIGKSGLQPGAFDKFTTFGPGPTNAGPGLIPNNLGNPDLKPEKSRELEFGTEIGLLDDRFGIDVTYWDRKTTDALIAKQFPVTGGFTQLQLGNIGQLDSHGWELKFDWLALDRNNLSISLFANASYLKEIVTSMGGAPPIKVGGSYPRYRNFLIEGYAPGTYFGAELVDFTPGQTVPYDVWNTATNSAGRDGNIDTEAEFKQFLTSKGAISLDSDLQPLMRDDDGDGDLNDTFLGKPTPDWAGSFGVNLTLWRNLQVNSLFEYKTGNYTVTNLTDEFRKSNPVIGRNTRQAAEVEALLSDPSTQTDADARFEAAMTWARQLRGLAPWSGLNSHENAKFLRWRELSISYTAAESFARRLGLENLVITLAGRNIAKWTPYTGIDQEMNAISRCGGNGEASTDCNFLDGVDAFGLPLPRRYSVTVQFGF